MWDIGVVLPKISKPNSYENDKTILDDLLPDGDGGDGLCPTMGN